MNMLGLIFADEHSSDIGDLTTRRTFAAIPFGARYRIIDFFISNMTNSGVRNIGVIATTKYESLMGHVRYGGEWDLHRRKTGLTVLPPFSFFNGDERYENILEALQANINYIKENSEPYVLFTCCNAIGNLDYSAMLEQHIASGARFTCLCTKAPLNKTEGMQTTEYVLGEDDQIEDIAAACGLDRSYFGKLFKREIGQSPQTFLITYRMIKATDMLLQTDLPISEIGQQVGYENQMHFSRAFKKYYGLSPLQWRNSHKTGAAGTHT